MDAAAGADRATRGALRWGRRTFDLVPTPWLVTAAGGALLAATAAFGGLAPAPTPQTPVLTVGETHTGSDLDITVLSAEIWPERANARAFPDQEKGERLLVVTVEAVNRFPSARTMTTSDPESWAIDGILVEGIDGKPAVSRVDGSNARRLQPDVPARLLLAWVVGESDLQDGDEVTLTLPDSTHRVGESVISGDYWTDVRVGAVMPVRVEEVRG